MDSHAPVLCQPCNTNNDVDDDGSILSNIQIDTIHNDVTKAQVQQWLNCLPNVVASDSYWLNDASSMSSDTSIAGIAQGLFDTLPIHDGTVVMSAKGREEEAVSLQLFPNKEMRDEFDANFHAAIQSSRDSLCEEIASNGTSNKHPLKMQFLACQPNFNFKLHSHPNFELSVPFVGQLYERRLIGMTFDPTVVERPVDLTPPSTSLSKVEEGKAGKLIGDADKENRYHYREPTSGEISRVKTSMQNILEQKITTLGNHGTFVNRELRGGQVLFNDIGTIHQSYTKEEGGCLILAIWSGMHADINSKQCDCCGIGGSELLVL